MKTRNRRLGRPSLLTPERADAIVQATAVGAAASLAAEAREDHEPADSADDPYAELYRRVNAARAQTATRALARVLRAGAGSLVLDERVRTYTDPVTGVDVEERQVRYLRPDWRASACWLARVFPEQYGPNAKSLDQLLDELAPAQPAAGTDEPRLAELAERLAVTLALQDTELPEPLQATFSCTRGEHVDWG
ncbi:hypothetical protein [Streptomyces sp. NPDC001165]|uniref:hypothetical protein n=1 Tax=Streptomyces sp. NPDC001165 TaxID=3364546 RepID=UPI0036CDEC7D